MAIESVEENMKFFSPRQIERAKRAREFFHTLLTPSTQDFKKILSSNLISNCPVTVEDAQLAEQIYGPDIGALKGKTTGRKPAPVNSNYIDIPDELYAKHETVTLAMDTMYVNKLPFLTTVSRDIQYRTAMPLVATNDKAYRSAVQEVVRYYNIGGFTIGSIYCDNEYRPLRGTLQDEFGISMNFANPQEHVPEAERNNRTIKERIRSTFHRLLFSKMPKVMVHFLGAECARKLNFFPPKGGISQVYSPRGILHHRKLDYVKHCSVPFGAYVQAHDEPTPLNSQLP